MAKKAAKKVPASIVQHVKKREKLYKLFIKRYPFCKNQDEAFIIAMEEIETLNAEMKLVKEANTYLTEEINKLRF